MGREASCARPRGCCLGLRGWGVLGALHMAGMSRALCVFDDMGLSPSG
jgi:hypothetical protein